MLYKQSLNLLMLMLMYRKYKIKQASSPEGYIFHKLLGKGSFGEVYFATRKSDGE